MWFIKLRRKLLAFIKFSVMGKQNSKCLFLGTPTHKNMGDHAIVYAQYKFIKDHFDNADIFEMSRLEYETYKVIVKLLTPKGRLIVVDGGGNLGTLWPVEDNCIRDIIGRFKNNPILVFPQTAYYEDSEEGHMLYDKTVGLINNCKNLIFMFRDRKSYELFNGRVVNGRILLCPDIVTYVDDANRGAVERQALKIGLCFRDDKEMVIDNQIKTEIIKKIKDAGFQTHEISTISPINIYPDKRNDTLVKIWNDFSSCHLVLTDRLHGMIFSAITGTKCIAFDNISKKVQGGHVWLEDLGYVKYCSGYEDFEECFKSLSTEDVESYNRNKVIKDYYEPIDSFIVSMR